MALTLKKVQIFKIDLPMKVLCPPRKQSNNKK